jgi:hypothetical protein
MRYLLILWAAPLAIFWGWFFLSVNDLHFGFVFLSREVHDLVFHIYGQTLGLDPAAIPMLVAKACIFDTLIIGAIYAFRRRREIAAWAREMRSRHLSEAPEAGRVHPAE